MKESHDARVREIGRKRLTYTYQGKVLKQANAATNYSGIAEAATFVNVKVLYPND